MFQFISIAVPSFIHTYRGWKKRLEVNNSSIKQKDTTFTPYFIQIRDFN